MSLVKATLRVEMRQTCDHLVEASIKIIKLRNGPHGGWISPHMSPWIRCKKTGDSNMTLVKHGLIINLPCEHAAHEYSLGERIF